MKIKSKRWATLAIVIAGIVGAGAWALPRVVPYVSATRLVAVPLPPGNIPTPTLRSIQWREDSDLTNQIIDEWAKRPLGDWKTEGKINAPRSLLARLIRRHDLDAANDYLIAQTPWGNAGSTWPGNPNGDYDFTMAGLIPILFLFGDDSNVLYPPAKDHLLNTLLPLDGGEPLLTVPRTAGLVPDTENHLLMTEGSRYLKNRWMMLHGSQLAKHDNLSNGLEQWLLDLIEEIRSAGPYEFNSIPYEGYTLTALLNLEAFGSPSVQSAARGLLDQLNWNYAVGSLRFRRFPPFRRQYAHAADTSLMGDRHVGLIKPWISLLPDSPKDLELRGNRHIAIWVCWSPYRLPDQTAQWIVEKPADYFIRIGHGPESSPEIYSGGPGYLLSGGGVHRGDRSLIVARPITLILDDPANELSEVLHLAGPGKNFRDWNNTGVWQNVAAAAGPVHIPPRWKPAAASTLWKIFQRESNLCVAVHSRDDFGVVHIVRSSDPEQVLRSLQSANSNAKQLRSSFQIPNGSLIRYDTHAAKNRWVIQQVDGRPMDRDFDRWPSMIGSIDVTNPSEI
ncbi:putative secreted protein, partial [Rhodopirellula maiorica SM1]